MIIIGVIILITGLFEWLIAPFILPNTPRPAAWLSLIITLIGVVVIEQGYVRHKKTKK